MRNNIEFKENTLIWEKEDGNGFMPENKVTKAVIMGGASKFKEAYLYDGGNVKQKIEMRKGLGNIMLEFVVKASRNWKIVLH